MIAGYYIDSNFVYHGFLRALDGTFTTFDAPGAGTQQGVGTQTQGLNLEGATTGNYLDASYVSHGFLRAPDGTFTTFDAPGAGTGFLQGTVATSINDLGQIVGQYIDSQTTCSTASRVLRMDISPGLTPRGRRAHSPTISLASMISGQ